MQTFTEKTGEAVALPASDGSEEERLAALHRYEVLDTPPEESFDRLTELASSLFDVPIALITLVDADRLWVKSRVGFETSQLDREKSFCTYTIRSEDVMVVEDATQDVRFSDNVLVTGEPHVRSYAGAPLVTPDGHALGALCVLDTVPRSFSKEQQVHLKNLAAMAMDELELRRQAAASARAKAAQQQERELMDDIVGGLPGIFYLFDESGYITRWNEPLEEISGYSPEEIRETHCLDFVYEEDRPHTQEAIREAFRTGEARAEARILLKDGTVLPCLCSARRLTIDGQVHLAGMAIDISERREAEHALAESERQYRTIVENVRDVVFQVDAEGVWTYLNGAWEEALGYTVEESLGRPFLAFVHPDDHEQLGADASSALFDAASPGEASAGASKQFPTMPPRTVRCCTKGGETRWLRMRMKKIIGEDGRVTGGVGTLTDITDSLHVDAEREARKRAEELLEARTSFLNSMSHELRTPLAAILGFADVLAEEGAGVQREFAERIGRGGRRLQKTLESVLSLAQLNGQDAELDLQPTGVVEAVRETTQFLRSGAEEKGLSFDLQTPEAEVHALLEEGALHRILDNLIGNAIKFTEEGGVTVRVKASAQVVRIDVEDTGVGISRTFQERLFEDFQQESKGLGRTHEGSGLGLAIVRRLTDLMDGAVEVASEKGEGARFTVSFPRVASAVQDGPEDAGALPQDASAPAAEELPARKELEEDRPAKPAGASATRLLVVEDNKNTRALATHVLKSRYEVADAADVDEALGLAHECSFDALVIDIDLGGGEDGTELLRRLQALPAHRSTPAVAFTAHAMPGDEERFREAGFEGYLAKPFSKQELLGAAAEVLGSRAETPGEVASRG